MKKLYLLLMFSILMLSSVSAFLNVKSYDSNTQTISIKDYLGLPLISSELATAQLKTAQNYQVGLGYQKVAEFDINSFTDINTILGNFELYDLKKNGEQINRQIDIKYLTTQEVKVNDYAPTYFKNGTISGYSVIGTHLENKEVWLPFDNNVKTSQVTTIGLFTDVKKDDKVEWIPNIAGVKINEWATWSGNLSVGLIHYYKFDGNLIDSVGTNNGTTGGSTSIPGKINQGRYFPDGTKVDLTPEVYNSSITYTAWLRLNATDGAGDGNAFYGRATNGSALEWASTLGTEIRYTFDGDADGQSNWYSVGANLNTTGDFFVVIKGTGGGGANNYEIWVNNVNLSTTNSGTGSRPTSSPVEESIGGHSYFTDTKGIVDEFAMWDRVLTPAEIGYLYNAGAGCQFGNESCFASPIKNPLVTLNAPSNYLNSSSSTTIFNTTINDINPAGTITNVTLYIDGIVNQTNSTAGTNLTYTFTKILSEGSHNWSILAYNNNSVSNQSSTRFLTIDTTPPVVTILSPLNNTEILTTSPTYNVTFNITATDNIGLTNCIYYNGTANNSITCGNNATINLTAGSWNLIYYANDTAGNIASNSTTFILNVYNYTLTAPASVIEATNQTIYFNLTASSISSLNANVSYNLTNYTLTQISNNGTYAIFSRNITTPEVSADTNVNISVYYTLNGQNFNTANQSQLIYNIGDLNVTANPCSETALNFTLKDEENLTSLNGTFDYNFIFGIGANSSHSRVFGTISNVNRFYVCTNSTIASNWILGSGEIFYNSPSYVDRRYYIFDNTTLNNQTNNITLYDLLSSSQTSFKLEISDTSLSPYVNKFTTLVRYSPDLNQYNVVDMGQTDETGATIIHVRTEDVDYRIGIYERNGTLIKLANPIRMVCLVTPCTYTLKISPTENDFTSFLNIQYTLDYNETSKIWTFTFVDTSQKTQEMNLTIYKLTGDNIYPICTNSITAYTGAVSCNTSGFTGTLKAVVVRTASPPVVIAQKIINAITSAFSSSFGLWISLLIGIPIVMVLAFMSPIAAVIGGVIALIPALYLGSINWAIMAGLAVMAGIILHMLKRVK